MGFWNFARSNVYETNAHLHIRNRLGIYGRGYPFVAYQHLIRNAEISPLRRMEIREVKEHCKRRFGTDLYYPYLVLYKAFNQIRSNERSLKEWMPNDFLNRCVIPRINKNYRGIARIKTLSRRLLGSELLPDIAYIFDKKLYDINLKQILPSDFVSEHCEQCNVVFVKPDNSSSGRGVMRVKISAVNEEFLESTKGDFVIQSEIVQNDWFSELSPGSSSTLRILTLFHGSDKPRKVGSYLRLPFGGEKICQKNVIRIGVLDDEGGIDQVGLDQNWQLRRTHPDSGVHFKGRKIPHFRDAVATCEEVHRGLPQIGLIGWDVGIDPAGTVKFMEWNAFNPTVDFPEMATGPMFVGCRFEELYR